MEEVGEDILSHLPIELVEVFMSPPLALCVFPSLILRDW